MFILPLYLYQLRANEESPKVLNGVKKFSFLLTADVMWVNLWSATNVRKYSLIPFLNNALLKYHYTNLSFILYKRKKETFLLWIIYFYNKIYSRNFIKKIMSYSCRTLN